jgi:hypothetical protein
MFKMLPYKLVFNILKMQPLLSILSRKNRYIRTDNVKQDPATPNLLLVKFDSGLYVYNF